MMVYKAMSHVMLPRMSGFFPAEINGGYFTNNSRIEGVHLIRIIYIDLKTIQFFSRGFPGPVLP
jgi:hypothetical protein